MKSHLIVDDKINKLLSDTEEMDEAVYINRFLKPIRQKRGVRGIDKELQKRRRSAQKDSDSNDVEEDEEHDEGSPSSTSDDEDVES